MEILPLATTNGIQNISLVPQIKVSPEMGQSLSIVNISLSPAVLEAEKKVKQQDPFFQQLTNYSLPTLESLVSADNIPVKGFNSHLPQMPLPIIEEGRKKALSKINSLLEKINKAKETILNPEEEISCPYERTKAKYLGRNYTPPCINELSYPEDFAIEKALGATAAINANYYNVMLSQMYAMSAEAINTNFAGITSENLGNAFAVLSSVGNESKYVLNEKKLADHLEFAEIVRNLPVQEIIDNPKEVAFKLIHKFIEINSDVDLVSQLPYSVSPMTIPSIEPIPQPVLEPQAAPRLNPLPIDHPALNYIAQPVFFQSSQLPEKVLTK